MESGVGPVNGLDSFVVSRENGLKDSSVVCREEDVGMLADANIIEAESFEAVIVVDDVVERM